MQETLVDDLCIYTHPLLRSYLTLSQWKSLVSVMMGMNQDLRKQCITLCRSACWPVRDTTLYNKTSSFCHFLEDEYARDHHQLAAISDSFTNPLISGLYISLCISLPMGEHAIRQTYARLLGKEMSVMESSPLPQSICYECFFGEYNRPLHPTLSPNPLQSARIHQIIDKWVLDLCDKDVILPHMTSKLVSKHTQSLVQDVYPDYTTFEEEGATQPDLESIYMKFGDELNGGSCEVKQRWYTSGLVPRTYYAAGSDAYHKSKYLRDAFNNLCDLLPPTERYARVNTRRLVLSSPDSHAIIYDLTSFTSNMHEQRHFLDRLASYCRGNVVRILDTIEGVIEADLGDLIMRYNDLNKNPTYSSDKLIGKGILLDHHIAGFLGVYGNLATCTFLHGAVMSCVVDSFQQIGIAGDDGIVDSYDDWITNFAIRLLGVMEESKGYSTNDTGNQVYLKRPVKQVGTRIYSESFALYSMFEHLFEEDDRRFFKAPRSRIERKKSLASSLVAYLRSISSLVISEDEQSQIRAFLEMVYKRAQFPEYGYVPYLHVEFGSHQKALPSVLIPSLDAIGHDPIEYTIKSLYNGCVVLPYRSSERIAFDSGMLYAGAEFECTGDRWLAFYRKMGFVEITQGNVLYVGEEGLDRLLEVYIVGDRYPVYNVSVIHDVPTQLQC
uniref:RNA-dependent RNA polymerase n=1 Tax=Downy mildew lesion associated ambivirus 1 TaxID=3070653 RepID=A0AA51UCN1_9VIRU|nr:MAG: putative RNA-dependent RNA polymerase [Downy mildew lesion associated ambivirus 1]